MRNSQHKHNTTQPKLSAGHRQTAKTQPDGAASVAADLGAMVQRVQSDPNSLAPSDLLTLQRSVGNQTVARMLGRDGASTPTASAAPFIQAKLKVGPANDVYEQEADRIANTVTKHVSAPLPTAQRSTKPHHAQEINRMPSAPVGAIRRIQRNAPVGAAGGELDPDVERRLRSSQGGGQPMPDAVRRSIEPKLGADLSNVKVHTGSQAVQLNRDLGAKAFTHGNHIYYGAGQSPKDLKLTAHEAVHTVQQGATATGTLQRKKTRGRQVQNNEEGGGNNKAKPEVPDSANRFTLTLAVWQDDPNFLSKSVKFVFKKAFHKMFGTKNKPEPPTRTGHSWVELRAYKSDQAVFADSYGFQPSGVKHPETGFHGSSGEDVLYRDYEISKEKFLNVIDMAESIVDENPKYDLKGMNCTKFARALVMAAGLKFMGNRVVPGAKFGPGKAFTPNRLFSAMANKNKKGKVYKLDEQRKDLKHQLVNARKPVTLYMMPDNETPHKFDQTDPAGIIEHRVYNLDPTWSEVIMKGEEGDNETWYGRTDALRQFLSGTTTASTESLPPTVNMPFSEMDMMGMKPLFEFDSEWEMVKNSYGYDKEQFTSLSEQQLSYLSELWEMPVEELKQKFSA